MKTVIVGSKNPVKINATKTAFEHMFPEEQFEFIGCSADSGVADQPKSDEETFTGVTNRVKHCREMYPDADYYAGLEGGIERAHDEWITIAWMYIEDQAGNHGKARSAAHPLPKKIQKLIDEGMELGHASDEVFNRENSKQAEGTIGIMTHGVVTRTDYYIQPMIFALVPFKNPELFAED
jgi:inosine/xanthosine triphosphatase